MEMDSMSEMAMGGMSSGGTFKPTNMALARDYWYLIAGVLGLMLGVRVVNYCQTGVRLRASRSSSVRFPTKPTNWFSQTWATITAVGREMSYPQLYIPIRWLSWMTLLPMGRIICLLVYWAVIIYMMAAGAIIKDAYYWERIGFRNAWVTLTQMPFLYLLASKTNIIGLIADTSYERLNWLHRWVARTMFVTATVHGFHFWTEWVQADFLEFELEMMPTIIRFGLASWAILLWMVVTSLKPFRSMAYEVFVMQHILAAILFLWVVYVHIPEYARYNVWFAVAAICFDRVFRLGLLVWQNIKFNPNPSRCKGGQRIGHQAQALAVGKSITLLTIKDVHFQWKAGQHLYLWLPRVGVLEAHPYTIACPHQVPETCICNSVQLVIRCHSGFSKRLHTFARKAEAASRKCTLTAFVSGPYGRPPRWDIFETLLFISASTGASFTLPILESVVDSKAASCIRRVDFLLTARQGDEIGFYIERLHETLKKARASGIELSVHISVTGNGQLEAISNSLSASASASERIPEKEPMIPQQVERPERQARGGCCSTDVEAITPTMSSPRQRLSQTSSDYRIHHSASRPDIPTFLQNAVEATGGETAVVICGGPSLVAKVRSSVAKLSDERAVHKGTGAQGIHLHVEEYCF